jgi:hypothetical protein
LQVPELTMMTSPSALTSSKAPPELKDASQPAPDRISRLEAAWPFSSVPCGKDSTLQFALSQDPYSSPMTFTNAQVEGIVVG